MLTDESGPHPHSYPGNTYTTESKAPEVKIFTSIYPPISISSHAPFFRTHPRQYLGLDPRYTKRDPSASDDADAPELKVDRTEPGLRTL